MIIIHTQKPLFNIFSLFTASALLAVIIYSGFFLAEAVRSSPLITKSRIVSAIVLDNGLEKLNFIENPSTAKLLFKYAEAYANAAITFENIPRQDLKNFLPIITLSGKDIAVQSFRFEGVRLIIYGEADGSESIDEFSRSLKETTGFKSIVTNYYTDIDNVNRFEIECS